MADSNACQMVLKYLLMNKDLFIKAFHNRVYAYSSGTKFKEVCEDLEKWVKKQEVLHEMYKNDPNVSVSVSPVYTYICSLTTCTHLGGQ